VDAIVVTFSDEKTSLLAPSPVQLRSAFFRSGERNLSGYIVDTSNLNRKFSVEVLIDGHSVRVVRADAAVGELLTERVGDGCYGFSCSLESAVFSECTVVEARLANLGTAVGTPIVFSQTSDETPQHTDTGSVCWLGGLRFSGWLAADSAVATAAVVVDGTMVMRVPARSWRQVCVSEGASRAVRGFDFHLPERFADGTAHNLTIVDDVGEGVSGSSTFFVAYEDGLRNAIVEHSVSMQEQVRVELLDRLLPMSAPFSRYQSWRESFALFPGSTVSSRGGIIIVGGGSAEDTLDTLQVQTHTEWIAASLEPTSEPSGLRSKSALAFLGNDGADCDFVVFTLAGTLLAPFALQRIAAAFAQFPQAQAVYSDLDVQSDDGSVWPLAFPAFDYERMLEQGYCAHLFALRRETAERSLRDGASSLYRLFNSILDNARAPYSNIVHLPGALGILPEFDKMASYASLASAAIAHLRRKGIKAQVTPVKGTILPAAHIIRKNPRLSTTIVIPTRNRLHVLRNCIDSILPAARRAQAELLILDNDSADPDMLDYLAEIEKRIVTVLRIPGEFSIPRLNNRAAKIARGDVLCLINSDIKALDDNWLEEMLSRMVADDVGAVGALLVSSSRTVRHGGIVLGPGFSATHAFNDRVDGDVGYGDLLCIAHECSAVAAACMVTRRSDYLEVDGMDEIKFPLTFHDVDYCLKLRAIGKRIVFTPHAKLENPETTDRQKAIKANHEERINRELQNLRAKWGSVLAEDPYYSPILSLDPRPFSALAWPARAMAARVNNAPVSAQIPPGF
jgi:O-antigen biosynthesis protein